MQRARDEFWTTSTTSAPYLSRSARRIPPLLFPLPSIVLVFVVVVVVARVPLLLLLILAWLRAAAAAARRCR
jgi:hypothetical protein